MKFIAPLLCLAAAGFAGYLLEPYLRVGLTGVESAPKSQERVKESPVKPMDEEVADLPEEGLAEGESSVAAKPTTEARPNIEPAPEPVAVVEPTPEVEAEPAPMAEEPKVEEVEEVKEVVQAAEEEEAQEEPAVAGPVVLAAEEIVELMKESIRSRQVKEFSFAEVLSWQAGEDEELDGESYQTGLISYKAETILGVKTVPAKALIQEGKVRKWIWPNTKTEIK